MAGRDSTMEMVIPEVEGIPGDEGIRLLIAALSLFPPSSSIISFGLGKGVRVYERLRVCLQHLGTWSIIRPFLSL